MNVELLPQSQQQGPGIADYVSVVRRRALHVIVPFLLFTGAGLGIAFLVPKEYQTSTQLYIEDDLVSAMFTPVGVPVPHKHLLTTLNQDVKRAEFLSPLVEQYGITEGFNPSVPKERTKLYEKIRRRLIITKSAQPAGPDLIEFIYEGRDAVRVTEFVNAVRRKWQKEFSERYSQTVKTMEENIKTVFVESQAKFTEAQVQLKNFQEANGYDYFGKDPGGQARGQLSQLKQDVETFEMTLKGEEAALRTVLATLDKVPAISATNTDRKRSSEWTSQNAKIEALAAKITQGEEAGYLDTWPQMKTARAQLELERNKLDTIEQWVTDSIQEGASAQWIALQTQKTQLEVSIATLKDKADKTKKRIAVLEVEVKVIPEKASRALALQEAVYTAQSQYDRASKTKEAAKATRDRAVGKAKSFFKVVQETTPEEAKFQDPVYPNYLLFAGIGAFIGLLIGGGLAFITEFAAASFTTPNQVRYALQVPVLGELSPLVTEGETRTRKRRKVQLLVGAALLLALIAVIHLMWFDPQWRADLPEFVRSIMRRLYGGGR